MRGARTLGDHSLAASSLDPGTLSPLLHTERLLRALTEGFPLATASAVHARGLVLRHDTHLAVDHADLDLPAGQRSVIIGPNGSGKSTLLRAISGLQPVTAGTLEVLGQAPGTRRSGLAHVLQAAVVNQAVPITVREVVGMGRYAQLGPFRRDRTNPNAVDNVLDRLDITEIAHRHLGELSVGQRQRVMVAQALVQEADLLLLDEPLAGLDLTSSERIERIITDQVTAGRTVVVTTHDLQTAMQATHVVLLATKVIATGRPNQVLTETNLSTAYGGHLHQLPGGGSVLDDPTPHGTGHGHGGVG